MNQKNNTENPVIDNAIKAMCDVGRITRDDLESPKRRYDVNVCRAFLFMYIRQNSMMSTIAIGRLFGRDHATVLHGIRRAKDMLETPGYKVEQALYADFINRMNNGGEKGKENQGAPAETEKLEQEAALPVAAENTEQVGQDNT